MDAYPTVELAGKLHSWMTHNIGTEREPFALSGEPISVELSKLVSGFTPLTTTDNAALAYATAVLEEFVKHKHAEPAPIATAQETAAAAAVEARKKLPPLPPGIAKR